MTVAHVKALLEEPEPAAPDGLAPVHHGKFTFTSCGMLVEGTPSYEEWAEVGGVLAVMHRGIQFLVGDWIAFGEKSYGELAAQAIDARSWSAETVRNYVWLAKSVPPTNRMLDRGLSVAHHQAVAHCSPKEQRTWLRKALSEETPWSVGRLKAAIKEGADPQPTAWLLMVTCASEAKQRALQKQLELDGYAVTAVTRRSAK